MGIIKESFSSYFLINQILIIDILSDRILKILLIAIISTIIFPTTLKSTIIKYS